MGRIEGVEAQCRAHVAALEGEQRRTRKKEEEALRLTSALTRLGEDEQGLNSQLDAHAERLSELTSSQQSLTSQLASARADTDNARSDVARLSSSLAARERDIASLRRRIEDLHRTGRRRDGCAGLRAA